MNRRELLKAAALAQRALEARPSRSLRAIFADFASRPFRADDTNPMPPDAGSLNSMAKSAEVMNKASKHGMIVTFRAWPRSYEKHNGLMRRAHAELAKLARKRFTGPPASSRITHARSAISNTHWAGTLTAAEYNGIPSSTSKLSHLCATRQATVVNPPANSCRRR